MDSMIDQKVYPHPQLPPPQQMHPNLMNQRPPNHQMVPHPPPHPHQQYQQPQHPQQQQQQMHQQQQQAQASGAHSVRPNMIRMQNTMPMQSMHQSTGPGAIKSNVHNSMPSNIPCNNSNNNGNNNNGNNSETSANATAAGHVFANGSHGSSNQQTSNWNSVKQEQPHCSGCTKPIYERHLLKAVDKLWHEDCLKCSACSARLGEVGNTLYFKNNLLLCKADYYRIYGQPGVCSACSQRILPCEMVMKAKSNNYHMDCFACQRCQHRFCVGDRFFLLENRVLCENDCENRSATTVTPTNVNMRGTRAPQVNQQQSKQQKMTGARGGNQ